MDWLFNNKEYIEIHDNSLVGFVYCITNLINNKKYIGKKLFWFSKIKVIKKKKKRFKIESNWKEYYGSSNLLLEDIDKFEKCNFKREILYFCKSKGMCSYLELKEQIDRRVLENNDYYNNYILARIHKSHIK